MKDQAERFPTVVASHGFNMRQTSSLALHLRSPFPDCAKLTLKLSAGSQQRAASSSADQWGSMDDFLNSAHPFDKFDWNDQPMLAVTRSLGMERRSGNQPYE